MQVPWKALTPPGAVVGGYGAGVYGNMTFPVLPVEVILSILPGPAVVAKYAGNLGSVIQVENDIFVNITGLLFCAYDQAGNLSPLPPLALANINISTPSLHIV